MRQFLSIIMIWAMVQVTCAQVTISDLPDNTTGIGGIFLDIDLSFHITSDEEVFWEYAYPISEETGSAPEWSLTSSYQYDMNVTAEVNSKGKLAEGDGHLLAVTDGEGEVRGTSKALKVGDKWVYFLTVAGNTAREVLSYQFYDSAYQQVLGSSRSLIFEPGELLGQPDTPVRIEVGRIAPSLSGNLLKTEIFDPEFVGTEALILTARQVSDPSQQDSDTVSFTVLDDFLPVFSGIPDQVVAFGSPFSSFDLNTYASSPDDDPLLFGYEEPTDLSVEIDANGVATITYPDGWSGSEELSFMVTENTANQLNDREVAVFTVRPEDQAPVIDLIPDQTVGVNGEFNTISLSEYVETNNPDAIKWSYEFVSDSSVAHPGWAVNVADFEYSMNLTAEVSTFGVPAEGEENILAAFSQSDSTIRGTTRALEVNGAWYFFLTLYSNNTEDSLYFRVFDSQTSRILPTEQTLEFEPNVVIGDPLDPFVIDAGYLSIQVEDGEAHVYFVTKGWTGVELIRFVATDTATSGLLNDADTIALEVLDLTAPILSAIPSQAIDEDTQFASIDLALYLEELGPSEVNWELMGADTLSPILTGNEVTFTVPPDYYGESTLTIKVTSKELSELYTESTVGLEVLNVNDAPYFTSTPQEMVDAGALYNYEISFGDIDSQDLELSVSGLPGWMNFFSGDDFGLLYGTPSATDRGSYALELSLSDGEVQVLQAFQVQVLVTIAPVLADIPDQQIDEDGVFVPIQLNDYLSALTPEEVEWSISGAETLSPQLTDGVVSFNVPTDYYGENTLDVTVVSLASSDMMDNKKVTLTVNAVNDAPYFETVISSVTVEVDSFYSVEIVALDVDNENLTITSTGRPSWLSLSTDGGFSVLSGVPGIQDTGKVNTTLTVSDGELEDLLAFEIEVVGVRAPKISPIPDQEIEEEGMLASIHLNDYLQVLGPDEVEWGIAGADTLNPMLSKGVVSFAVPANYYGTNVLEITAASLMSELLADTASVHLIIRNVNDAPYFTSAIEDQTLGMNDIFSYEISAEDVDGDVLMISAIDLPGWLSLTSNGGVGVLSGVVAEPGNHKIILQVSDGVLSAFQEINLMVEQMLSIGSDEILLFPNPSRDLIQLRGLSISEIEMLDALGRKVDFSVVGANRLSMKDLPAGHYSITYERGGELKIIRVIKH